MRPKQQKLQTHRKMTEYPVTITTYGSDGLELETTYEKRTGEGAGSLPGLYRNPFLALGLEDHIVATAGLDNEVPEDQKAAFFQNRLSR